MATQNIKQDDKNLALLKNRLQLPMVVRHLLNSGESLEDDTKYAMHTLLSDLDAISVLLCAALCLKEIADYEGMDFAGYNFLHTECNRMIKRYTHAHLFIENDEALSDERFSGVLEQLVIDLDNFSEILELCRMSFEILGPHTAEILDVLSKQVESQILVIDEVLDMRGEAQDQERDFVMDFDSHSVDAENVIPFRSLV